MTGICCGVVGEGEAAASVKPSSRPKRKRIELLQFKYIADAAVPADPLLVESRSKRQQILDLGAVPEASASSIECGSAVENCQSIVKKHEGDSEARHEEEDHGLQSIQTVCASCKAVPRKESPKFGVTSVCGRRRDMEDAVSVRPYFCDQGNELRKGFHLYGVYDGHGCSHVATMCKERLYEIVKEELLVYGDDDSLDWKGLMKNCFSRMDDEVSDWSNVVQTASCRCELQTPHSEAVGSTAVVSIVTPDKIIVSNCGDSRAVLCRNGVAIPLSSDHKPDRPDELLRVEAAGGRVIYWDGPRVLGVLAMSRAIGDGYLKPYVICEPEVTVIDRTDEDECLILASDGLWDVVQNDTACSVASMCLRAQKPPSPPVSPGNDAAVGSGSHNSDKACCDASILLTKLALARHSTDNVSVVVVDLRRDHQAQVNRKCTH